MRAIFMILLAAYFWYCMRSMDRTADWGNTVAGMFMLASWLCALIGIALMIMGV